jgi:actin-like protein 6A
VLACFANARSSGLVLDIGGSVTSAVPVHDGQLVAKAVKRSALAGSALSRELADAIEAGGEYRGGAAHGSDAEDDSTAGGGQRSRAKGAAGSGGYALHPRCTLAKTRGRDGTHPILPQGELDKIHQTYLTWARLELADEIKRTHCHVHVSELGGSGGDGAVVPKLPFELPDGTIVHVGAERFQVNPLPPQLPRTLRCLRRRVHCPPPPPLTLRAPPIRQPWPQVPELLFEPGVGRFAAVSSLPKLLCDAALDCELDIRKELFASVIVTGGGSAIRGLEARLSKGVVEMAPPVLKVKTLAAPAKERRLGAWLGGSILGSLGSCHDMWVSKAEYAESGSAIIEKKCP